jgi:hypothetical protein
MGGSIIARLTEELGPTSGDAHRSTCGQMGLHFGGDGISRQGMDECRLAPQRSLNSPEPRHQMAGFFYARAAGCAPEVSARADLNGPSIDLAGANRYSPPRQIILASPIRVPWIVSTFSLPVVAPDFVPRGGWLVRLPPEAKFH